MSIKAASCFSGIGAPEQAMPWCDWLWHSEIEPFPNAVMAHYHPGSVGLGDILSPDFIDRAKAFGPLDLLVGGPPCQAFSLAGARNSLSDPRGNLSLRWVQVLHAVRPRNVITENVPGWLSARDNAFGCFLGAVVGADDPLHSPLEQGRWPDSGMVAGPRARAAWRILNAQHFGLAQRRRRVFVVIDFGDGADPAEVLFEPKGLQGDIAPGQGERKDIAPTLSARTKGGGGLGTDFECDGGLIAASLTCSPYADGQGRESLLIPSTGDLSHCLNAGAMGRIDYETETFITHATTCYRVTGNDGAYETGDISAGLTTNTDRSSQVLTVSFCTKENQKNAYASEARSAEALRALCEAVDEEAFSEWIAGVVAAFWPQEVLQSGMYGGRFRQSPQPKQGLVNVTLSRQKAGAYWSVQGLWQAGCDGCPPQGWRPSEQLARELGASLSELPYAPSPAERLLRTVWPACEGSRLLRETLSALEKARRSACGKNKSKASVSLREASGCAGDVRTTLHASQAVRRLLVEECETLQGFPRGYTLIPYRRKMAADGPRYKALGNSMAVPVMAWIGARIRRGLEKKTSSVRGCGKSREENEKRNQRAKR